MGWAGSLPAQIKAGVIFTMTPETYMRRYHGSGCGKEAVTTLPAEELYPSCPLEISQSDNCNSTVPAPLPTCCCKASMVEALHLLCGTELADLVDFDAFFFLTENLSVGGYLTVPGGSPDNISGLDASFRRFSPCNCDLIDVDGARYFTDPGSATAALDAVDQLTLCSVKALAFGLTDPDCPEDCPDAVYRRTLRAIRRAIRAEGGEISSCATCGGNGATPHCDCDDCCCDSGILTELASRNLSRLATLTAGDLILQNVTVLGAVGSVLILADDSLERIYFVCVSQIEALG